MALALTRAAAAAALRRSATGAPLHRAVALGPQLPRFARLHGKRCYRQSGPADPAEEPHQQAVDDLQAMEKEAKQGQCNCKFDPVQAEIDVRNVRNDLQEVSNRITEVQKATEKHKDITSIYIKNFGSVNVIAVTTACFTLYQIWTHKLF